MKKVERYLWSRGAAAADAFEIHRVRQSGSDEKANSLGYLHTHAGYSELFWVQEGRGHHVVNGQAMPIETGDLVMVRTEDVHTLTVPPGLEMTFINVSFPASTLESLRRRYFHEFPDFFNRREEKPVQKRLEPGFQRRLEESCSAVAWGTRDRLAADAFLIPLFLEIFRPPSKQQAMDACPGWLQEACRRIRELENFSQGLRRFEALAGRGREHVARETKKWLGSTPTELINQCRLEYIAEKLSLTDKKINDLAMEAGFSSTSHFYRLFQKYFRVSPRLYRLRRQQAFAHPLHQKKST